VTAFLPFFLRVYENVISESSLNVRKIFFYIKSFFLDYENVKGTFLCYHLANNGTFFYILVAHSSNVFKRCFRMFRENSKVTFHCFRLPMLNDGNMLQTR